MTWRACLVARSFARTSIERTCSGLSISVIAGPKKPLIGKEIEAIKKYIDNGGKAVFMIEPRSAENLVSLLRSYGFDLKNDIIIDPSSKLVGGGDIAPIVAEYPSHDITNDFRFVTMFPYGRSVNVTIKDEGKTAVIANTSKNSWSEGDYNYGCFAFILFSYVN